MQCHGKNKDVWWTGALGPCPRPAAGVLRVWSRISRSFKIQPACAECGGSAVDESEWLTEDMVVAYEVMES